jgi:hypothetical protein
MLKKQRQAECLPHPRLQTIDCALWGRRFRLPSSAMVAFFSIL